MLAFRQESHLKTLPVFANKVKFSSLSIQDFRNMPLARLDLGEGPLFIVGGNGRGKTSLLEALCLVSALRSFRTTESRAMIRHKTQEARLVCRLEQEKEGSVEIDIRIRSGSKAVSIDGNPLDRLGDLMGRFPTVPLSSQDIQLLRSGPGLRRRFTDLMLASAHPGYFDSLRRFTRALKGRNSILREGGSTRGAELAAFEPLLSTAAAELCAARREAFARLSPLLHEAYSQIAPSEEQPDLRYKPDFDGVSAEQFAEMFAKNRQRDISRASTGHGPHLDDFELLIHGRQAREYASEGQQRGLVLALRMAQARWLEQCTGIVPVVLADDIIGELDPQRRAAFWASLDGKAQLIATGTELPAGREAQERFHILDIETLHPQSEEAAQ